MSTPINSVCGTSTLVRAKFGPGMLLQHDDLERLNSYTRDLSRMMFRSFFGCGVVCGLVVEVEADACGRMIVKVGAGLALTCSGDPIYVPKEQRLLLNPECHPNPDSQLWLELCGKVKCCAPRTAICACDDDEPPAECTQERDGYEIRLWGERPPCACGCPEPDENAKAAEETACRCVNPEQQKCYEEHYAGKCGCACDDCSDCGCECILLARLDKLKDPKDVPWGVDHRVRRFIRPVLMRDPQVKIEDDQRKAAIKHGADKDASSSAEIKSPDDAGQKGQPKPATPAAKPKSSAGTNPT